VQYAAIPEFRASGTSVGRAVLGRAVGRDTVDAALAAAQSLTKNDARRYIK